MAPLANASRSLLAPTLLRGTALRTSVPATVAATVNSNSSSSSRKSQLSTSAPRQAQGHGTGVHFKSPFVGEHKGAQIPDFSKYKTDNEEAPKMFGYFMVGTMAALSAAGAKSTVHEFLVNMAASADVLAMAKVEVDLNTIPEGKNVIIKWRGKPIFIRHRTQAEIDEANKVNITKLRHQEKDEDRVKKPEWLVMLGVCTHLGCVPIGEAGEYGGWFCPCHGSHYDISGRIRKGPAPLNLEIPEYDFPEEGKLVIG